MKADKRGGEEGRGEKEGWGKGGGEEMEEVGEVGIGLNQYQVITAKVQGYLVSVKPKPITIMFEAIVSGNKFYYRLDFIQRKHWIDPITF